MKIIIICPSNVRTGGPEALHQLSDSLIGFGIQTLMWYMVDSDQQMLEKFKGDKSKAFSVSIGKRTQEHADYDKYRVNTAEELIVDDKTIIVLPEAYLEWANYFPGRVIVIWWLSFDNSLRSLVNSKLNFNALRQNHFIHAYQSDYAKGILNALGLPNLYKLTDFTPVPFEKHITKNKIALNAGGKVIFNTEIISKNITDALGIEVNLIKGLTRGEVYKLLCDSYCYIDLGNFPGKDRMPREAVLFDCIPIVLDVAGAKEYLLPEILKINLSEIDTLSSTVKTVVSNHEAYLEMIQPFISSVLVEESDFKIEVLKLIHHFNSRGLCI